MERYFGASLFFLTPVEEFMNNNLIKRDAITDFLLSVTAARL